MANSFTSSKNGNKAGNLTNRTTTVEFVGPPGAGKTTSCKYFSSLFKENGLTVCEIHDIKDFVRKKRFAGKLHLLLQLILFRTSRLTLYTILLLSNKVYSLNSIYRYIRLNLFDLALVQLKKKRELDVVLLDQWIIQEMWSATIFRAKKYSRLSKRLSKFYFRSDVVIYFDIDIRTASERIKTRPTNLSRFDKMDERKRIDELQKYTSYLFDLYKSSDCKQKHLFSGHESPESNAALFGQYFDINYQLN
jgi:thymidylate kinase